MHSKDTYTLGAADHELARLRRQSDTMAVRAEQLFDRIGVQPGWKVLDMGCGPRGVLDLLSARVGPEGSVTGVDANPVMVEQARAFAAGLPHPNVTVVAGNATDVGALPRGAFDLVHARLLLINLPGPLAQKAVGEMLSLVRPGGIIALQDVDGDSWACDPPHPAWDKLFEVFKGVAGDGRAGRRLPRHLREAGAEAIECEAHGGFLHPGHVWRNMLVHFSDLTRPRALQLGLATVAELDDAKAALLGHLEDPTTTVLAPIMAQAWGRRPA